MRLGYTGLACISRQKCSCPDLRVELHKPQIHLLLLNSGIWNELPPPALQLPPRFADSFKKHMDSPSFRLCNTGIASLNATVISFTASSLLETAGPRILFGHGLGDSESTRSKLRKYSLTLLYRKCADGMSRFHSYSTLLPIFTNAALQS